MVSNVIALLSVLVIGFEIEMLLLEFFDQLMVLNEARPRAVLAIVYLPDVCGRGGQMKTYRS